MLCRGSGRSCAENTSDELKRRIGKKKADYGYTYILSRVHGKPKVFIEITPLDVKFKPLLLKERMLADELQRLRQMQILKIDAEGCDKRY